MATRRLLCFVFLLLQQCSTNVNAFAIVGENSIPFGSNRLDVESDFRASRSASLPLYHHHRPISAMQDEDNEELRCNAPTTTTLNRRNLLQTIFSSSLFGISASILFPLVAVAADDDNDNSVTATATKQQQQQQPQLPMISVKELESLFRTSAKSIRVVEFSGPRSDVVTVQLVDGVTKFGLSDVIESSTDPRSPLRVAAMCREFKVPTKFSSIEAILAKSSDGGSAKKKLYTNNDRVRQAQVKEKEKKQRMEQDEADRLVELYQWQQQRQN